MADVTGYRAQTDGFFADGGFDFEFRCALGRVAYGLDAGELLSTAARITDGDQQSWFDQWSSAARRVESSADASLAAGNAVSAGSAFLRASDFWSMALGAVDGLSDQSVLLPTFQSSRRCWESWFDANGERFERIEVPYEQTTLPGWLLRPDASGQARPTLVMTNGSDGSVASLYSSGAAGALDRGWNAFVYDGPGQQSMLFERNTSFRPDWEAVLTPVVDTLAVRPDVDERRLVAHGISQAGYWVPRALAHEHRFAAAVADPGVVDVSTSWVGHLPPELVALVDAGQRERFDSATASFSSTPEQDREFAFRARPYGSTDLYDVLRAVRGYALGDLATRITTPLLVTDPDKEQFWPGQSQQLCDALPGSTTKELVRFTTEEGADWHCEPLARRLVDQRVFDWLAGQLPP